MCSCRAPFRERTSYVDWLNSQKRKDLTIGVAQEDPTQAPIFALSPSSSKGSRIDIGIHSGNSQITMRISPESGHSEISLQISPPPQSSQIDEWFDIDAFGSGVEPEIDLRDVNLYPYGVLESNSEGP
jgi:hypothetical protein